MRKTAQSIVKGDDSDVDKARALYEWVVENTFRDPKVRGCGWGDIKSMLETGNLGGKCGDLNALFVGLARSVGVPARDVYGLRVAPSEHGYRSLGVATPSVTRAQHCRAEFFAAGRGWVPVDPADVRKVALEEPPGNLALSDPKVDAARQRLFGNWEMNWLAYNMGHDIALPHSSGPRLPYLMYPNGETGGERLDQLDPDALQVLHHGARAQGLRAATFVRRSCRASRRAACGRAAAQGLDRRPNAGARARGCERKAAPARRLCGQGRAR